MKQGLFVTCEGGEGAGKTTLLSKLEKELVNRGYEVVLTREPGGSQLGESIRQWLLNRDFHATMGKKAELLLFLAARAQHIEELIKPSLNAGKVVLCDRFNDSTVAYQGLGRALGMEFVQKWCDLVCEDVIPNLTFFLDVDPQEGLRRTKRISKENAKAGSVDRIEAERLEFHQKVRQGLLSLAKQYPQRIVRIDANQSDSQVFAEALHNLESRVSKDRLKHNS